MVHFGIKSVAEVCRATECRTRKIQVDVLPVGDLCKKSAKWHFLVGGATQVTRYRLESSFFLHHFYVYDHEKVTSHGSVRRSSLVSGKSEGSRLCEEGGAVVVPEARSAGQRATVEKPGELSDREKLKSTNYIVGF